jgi:hypothetical protein
MIDTLPTALLVDVDGTVADMGKGQPGRRAFNQWHRVLEDTPIQPIVRLVAILRAHVDKVVWLSGRDEVCRADTKVWLTENAGLNPAADELVMRKHKDNRPDYIVKAELYDAHIAGVYLPLYVLDDRNTVVAMWRSRGLTVLQVAEGNF